MNMRGEQLQLCQLLITCFLWLLTLNDNPSVLAEISGRELLFLLHVLHMHGFSITLVSMADHSLSHVC